MLQLFLVELEEKISAAQKLIEELKKEKSQVAGLPLNGEEFKVYVDAGIIL